MSTKLISLLEQYLIVKMNRWSNPHSEWSSASNLPDCLSVEMSCNISVFEGPSVELYDISYDNTFAITNNKTNNVMTQ